MVAKFLAKKKRFFLDTLNKTLATFFFVSLLPGKKWLSQDKMEDPRTLGCTLMGLISINGSLVLNWLCKVKNSGASCSPTEPKPQLLAVGLIIYLVNVVICFYLLNSSRY
jgi:hypothetical protein